MAYNNFSNLKAAIRDKSHRNDMTDARLEDFISLAEAEMWQRLRIQAMQARATAAAPSDQYLVLPDDFIQARNVNITIGGTRYKLHYHTPFALNRCSGSGVPRQFTISDGQIEFDRIPSSGTVEVQYWKRITGLSSSNTTNAILTSFPNLYYYGILKYLYDWTDQDDKSMKYAMLFDAEVKDVNRQDKRAAHGPAPAMRVSGYTP